MWGELATESCQGACCWDFSYCVFDTPFRRNGPQESPRWLGAAQQHGSRSQPGLAPGKHRSDSVGQPPGGPTKLLRTPRPGPGVGVLGQQSPRSGSRSGGQPGTILTPRRSHGAPVLPRERSASLAGQKPGCRQGLTFNRLDVAMFSTWTLARQGETWRRSGPGLLERPGFPAGPRRPRRGMRGAPERRAVSAELVPGTRASSGFPATWSPRPAHARERMQTLEETRVVNGGKGQGADLTGKR